VHSYGSPEVLKFETVDTPEPGPGEAVVKVSACGVNYIDVYFRKGLHKAPAMPFTPGHEAAGTVSVVAPDVTDVRVGDRVAFAMTPGAYAEYVRVQAWKCVQLPEKISFKDGAALMLQGCTAHYLSHSTFPLKAGHTALIHAGAGGVGLLLTQIAKKLGATVLTTVGTPAKADLSRQAGADEVILYAQQDFAAEVKRLTSGRGVDVVYDSVGIDTFDKSLNCLRQRGYMVLYGQASGPVPPVDPTILNSRGSLFLTRPSLAHYAATRQELLSRTADLFSWVASGDLKLRIPHVFPLADAAAAHRELEGRRTTGKVILTT
jgi:NADPH2:quinone reductase